MSTAQPVVPYTSCCRDLPLRHDPVRHARNVVRRHLASVGLTTDRGPAVTELIDAAALIASELVSNACHHTSGPQTMRLTWDGTCLVVDVDDPSPIPPASVPEDMRGEGGGFGMQIVSSLAETWYVLRRDEGKTVRACISHPQLRTPFEPPSRYRPAPVPAPTRAPDPASTAARASTPAPAPAPAPATATATAPAR
ncbi:ATP-binding protein [Streptomyces sp. NPDC048639]|uniref:ATP-binding protein n=1 Tax=Streptomyces sp. NPDC048639 TaxID=3365581 RepID=UPI00371D04FD